MSGRNFFYGLGLAAAAGVALGLAGCGKKANPAEARSAEKPHADERPARSADNRLTHAKVDALQPGMTEKEARNLLGTPDTEAAAGGGGNEKVLAWMAGDRFVSLTFQGGRLKTKTVDGLEQTPSRLTRTNLERIELGMDPDSVIEILGPGKGELVQDTTRTVTWQHGDKLINIQFVDGKVTFKTAQGVD